MAFVAWLIAFVCFLVAALLGFGVFSGSHYYGWLALGLVFVAVAFLVGAFPAVSLRRGE